MFGILENKWLHIQGYYYKKYMNFTMELHKHNRLELMYCANGSFTFEYLDEESERNQVIVEQNCFILIKPDIPHRLLVTDGYAIIMNLEFDIETASNNYFNFSNLLRNMPPPPPKNRLYGRIRQRQREKPFKHYFFFMQPDHPSPRHLYQQPDLFPLLQHSAYDQPFRTKLLYRIPVSEKSAALYPPQPE